jgi:hypothetical protein
MEITIKLINNRKKGHRIAIRQRTLFNTILGVLRHVEEGENKQ